MTTSAQQTYTLNEILVGELLCDEVLILVTVTKGGDPQRHEQLALVFPGSCRVYAYTRLDPHGQHVLKGYKIVEGR